MMVGVFPADGDRVEKRELDGDGILLPMGGGE